MLIASWMAATRQSSENTFSLICFGILFVSVSVATNMANVVPAAKGMAIRQSIVLACIWLLILLALIKAMVASVVVTTIAGLKLLTLFKLGTMTKPPPTPSNPDKNPAIAPVPMSRLVQEAVQNN